MGLDLSGGYGAQAAGQTLKDLLAQRMAMRAQQNQEAQRAFENQMAQQDMEMRREQFRQQTQDRAAALGQRVQGERDTTALKAAPQIGMGNSIPGQQFQQTFANTAAEPNFTAQQTLPATQMTGTGEAGSLRTTAAPQTPTGRMLYLGTPEQRKEADDQEKLNGLINDPNTPEQVKGFLRVREVLPKGENPPAALFAEPKQGGGSVHDTAQGLARIGPDGNVTPVTDASGKRVQGYHPPPQPVLIQTPTGPIWAPKGGGASTPVQGPNGQPVEPAPSQQERNRRSLAESVRQQIPDVQREIDEADRAGLLGPLAGRTVADFLGGQIGTTGDPAKDELLGRLRMDMAAVASGFSSLHGRGGANTGMARDIESKLYQAKMNPALIKGGLAGIDKWVAGYSGKGQEAAGASGGTVPMVAPDGRSLNVPADKVAELEALGAKRR